MVTHSPKIFSRKDEASTTTTTAHCHCARQEIYTLICQAGAHWQVLKILALPACTIGEVCDQVKPGFIFDLPKCCLGSKMVCFRWKWSNVMSEWLQHVQRSDLKTFFFFGSEIVGTWMIKICLKYLCKKMLIFFLSFFAELIYFSNRRLLNQPHMLTFKGNHYSLLRVCTGWLMFSCTLKFVIKFCVIVTLELTVFRLASVSVTLTHLQSPSELWITFLFLTQLRWVWALLLTPMTWSWCTLVWIPVAL